MKRRNSLKTASKAQDRKGHMTRLTVVVIVCLLGLGVFLLFHRSSQSAASPWFDRVSSAQITYDGRPSPSQLYRRGDGRMILLLIQEEGSLAYYIVPSDKKVFFRPPNSLVISPESVRDKLGGNPAPPGVDLGYVQGIKSGSIKDDTNSRMVGGTNYIGFHSLDAKRVNVRW